VDSTFIEEFPEMSDIPFFNTFIHLSRCFGPACVPSIVPRGAHCHYCPLPPTMLVSLSAVCILFPRAFGVKAGGPFSSLVLQSLRRKGRLLCFFSMFARVRTLPFLFCFFFLEKSMSPFPPSNVKASDSSLFFTFVN